MYVTPWTRPFADALEQLRQARSATLASGDMAFEVYAAAALALLADCAGAPLAEVQACADSAHVLGAQRHNPDFEMMMAAKVRWCAALRGLSPERANLGNEESSNAAFGTRFNRKQTPVAMAFYYFLNAHLAFSYDDVRAADRLLAQAERYIPGVTTPAVAEMRFWRVLVDARVAERAPMLERLQRRRRIAKWLERLAHSARMCPDNFAAQYRIALAAHATVFDRRHAGARLTAAVEAALQQPGLKWEPLARELAWRHFADQGELGKAEEQRAAAVAAYARWGAEAKARALAERVIASRASQ
jgi:hypothetical protein